MIKFRAGDAVFLFALWVWMTISVGPWWVGALIFVIGSALNIGESQYRKRHEFDRRPTP